MKDSRTRTPMNLQKEVFSYLDKYEKQGVRITVGKKEYAAAKAAQAITLNENDNYMPDYLTDDTGRLVEIHYTKTRHY